MIALTCYGIGEALLGAVLALEAAVVLHVGVTERHQVHLQHRRIY